MRRLVTSKQLQRWAEEDRDARALLPGLVRRLAHATLDNIQRIDFPAYESVQRPNFDGEIECTMGNAWVPPGHSVWEISVKKKPASKAKDDFEKRTNKTAPEVRQNVTYVVLTARHWRDKKKWEAEANASGEWKAVRAYDSDDIEQWAENAFAVTLWLAEVWGFPVQELHDLEHRWNSISRSTAPALSSRVFLTSRERCRQALIEWLSEGKDCLTIVSQFPAEIIDFVCASVEALDQEQREAVRSCMVIAESATALRELCRLETNLVVLVDPRVELTGEDVAFAKERGIRLIRACEPFDPLPGSAIRLERVREHELARSLQQCGLSQFVAEKKAKDAGGSLALLKQSLDRIGCQSRTDAIEVSARGSLRACLILGGWNGANPADRTAVEQLAGKSYSEVESDCKLWANCRDPILIHADNKWRLVSKADAWAKLKSYISNEHLADFAPLAVSILSERDPRFELPNKERWLARIKGFSPQYSQVLKKHLADTLALLGSFGEIIAHEPTLAMEGFSHRVVREVLSPDSPWELWASLNSLLPLLAEASPDAFLAAIESDLDLLEPKLSWLFKETKGHPLLSGCLYSGLLWSLETLAWAPEHLSRVCSALLKLHKHHGPNNYGNSPMGSLQLILSCALPYTTADVELRIGILKQLLERDESSAWVLYVALLEQFRGGMSPQTSRPAWRGWAADWEPYADMGRQLDVVSTTVLEHVGNSLERWLELIDLLTMMPKSIMLQAIHRLAELPSTGLDDHSKSTLREKILDYVSRYRSSGATDRIGEDNLDCLENIANAMQPASLPIRYAPLFEQWMNRYYMRRAKYEENQTDLEKDRRRAIEEVIEGCGLEGVYKLAELCQQPYAVGHSLSMFTGDQYQHRIIPDLIREEDNWSINFVYGYVAARFESDGWAWFVGQLGRCNSDSARAWMFAMLPFGPDVWDRVDEQNAEVKRLYWSNVKHWGIDKSAEVVQRCVAELVAVGRLANAVEVLCAALHDKSALSSDTLLLPLEAILDSPGEVAKPQMSGIHNYDVGMILTAVQEAGDVEEARLIRLEINFLSMLGEDREGEPTTLFRKLATEPAFFVDILSSCYRSTLEDSDEEVNELREVDAKRRALAHIAHELLYKWKFLPGTNNDGTVDEQELWKWANSAREIAEPLGYLDTCDFRIGELISHGPTDSDGSWPARSVRRVVEKISTERLAAGIYIGIINSRGIVCRGEGGAQERDLATKYKTFAEHVRADAPFTASVLDRICAYYLGEGREWDNRDEWER